MKVFLLYSLFLLPLCHVSAMNSYMEQNSAEDYALVEPDTLYIEKEETLRAYIATLAACTNAQQVGEAVAQMCADEPKLNGDLIAKEKFIRLLLPFLVRLEKGKGIDNLRLNINEAWAVYKRNRREKGL